MRFEFSAGGVVFKKEKKKLLILVAQHSYHHGWVFPKGLIGDKIEGESKESTAIREVEEETGIKAQIVEAIDQVTYWFKFNAEKIKKTVYYYVMEYVGGDTNEHDFEMEDVKWIESEKVLEKLTYKSDKEVFKKALPIIEKTVDVRR